MYHSVSLAANLLRWQWWTVLSIFMYHTDVQFRGSCNLLEYIYFMQLLLLLQYISEAALYFLTYCILHLSHWILFRERFGDTFSIGL